MAPAARSTNPALGEVGVFKIHQAAADRARRYSGRPRHRDNAAVAGGSRLGGGKEPPTPLVKAPNQGFVAQANQSFVDHPQIIDSAATRVNPAEPASSRPKSIRLLFRVA
jgi:hypothetical protein